MDTPPAPPPDPAAPRWPLVIAWIVAAITVAVVAVGVGLWGLFAAAIVGLGLFGSGGDPAAGAALGVVAGVAVAGLLALVSRCVVQAHAALTGRPHRGWRVPLRVGVGVGVLYAFGTALAISASA